MHENVCPHFECTYAPKSNSWCNSALNLWSTRTVSTAAVSSRQGVVTCFKGVTLALPSRKEKCHCSCHIPSWCNYTLVLWHQWRSWCIPYEIVNFLNFPLNLCLAMLRLLGRVSWSFLKGIFKLKCPFWSCAQLSIISRNLMSPITFPFPPNFFHWSYDYIDWSTSLPMYTRWSHWQQPQKFLF